MFGSSSTKDDETKSDNTAQNNSTKPSDPIRIPNSTDEQTYLSRNSPDKKADDSDKKRRSSVTRAKDMFSNARQSLHLSSASSPTSDKPSQSSMQKLSKSDPALGVPQGSQNNSAGESVPGPRSTFRVGVTEDKNKKCRRTMEDTHAYLYNFLSTPLPSAGAEAGKGEEGGKVSPSSSTESANAQHVETDNGYFAIFDGHAGTFAADWCGKKLHLLLEDTIRKNPNTAIPELLDQTFTQVDKQLETLPVKNSGCTAVIAVLRWEDRVPNPASATGSAYINQAAAKESMKSEGDNDKAQTTNPEGANSTDHTASSKLQASEAKLRQSASRQRVLYTANVGDARIVLCRNGRALRLSYDHKGSDENEGRRVANAGGLILNNRVNGVLAVTRALGDSYMKDLVTGHPYTTETVIQPDHDEFLILACDGLWDVCTDQEAVDLVRNTHDPQAASKTLVDHALQRFSTDNLSCMIVRFDNDALKQRRRESCIGVEGDTATGSGGPSEADVIVSRSKGEDDGAEGAGAGADGEGPETIMEEEDEGEEDQGEGVGEGDSKPVGQGEGEEFMLNKEAVERARKD